MHGSSMATLGPYLNQAKTAPEFEDGSAKATDRDDLIWGG